ncbi:MAG: mannose-1-phosphate guanylyltransferase [Gemmatimonadaceae bacterium]
MSGPRWAVVLAGGVGSRFWPLSTPERPKQLLSLVDDRSLLENTIDRLQALVPAERTLVLTNLALVDAIAAAAPSIDAANIIAEPRPAGTAAALAYAAAIIARRAGDDAVMTCVHADWSIGDPDGFRNALSHAADIAEREHGLVTVGIVPTRPDPGFGYIEPGTTIERGDARRVSRFVEKPTRERAAEMVAQGYLWNSGIFVWRVGDFLNEIRAHTPEVATALDEIDEKPDAADRFFSAARSISVDVGVLERSACVYVIPGDFGWDDVGTWAALHRVRAADSTGNVASGTVHAAESSNNVVHAEANAVVLYGVSDLVVITRAGLTVVTTREKSADLKSLIASLPAALTSGS